MTPVEAQRLTPGTVVWSVYGTHVIQDKVVTVQHDGVVVDTKLGTHLVPFQNAFLTLDEAEAERDRRVALRALAR